MRRVAAAPDPESLPRLVVLPASWEDEAAAGLAALLPGRGPVVLAQAADAWIAPLDRAARGRGVAGLDGQLRELLLRRQLAPDAALWSGTAGGPVRLVLALSAFHDPQLGLDLAALEAALDVLARLPEAAVSPAGLDGLLAALGLEYDGQPARDVAACLVALLRGRLEARDAEDGPTAVGGPVPPACVIPALTQAARAAWAGRRAGRPRLVLAPAGPVEALLGVETAGIAPAFAPVTVGGRLTRATQARLAACGCSPEAALAALLSGEALFRPAPVAAQTAMEAAVAPFLGVSPAVHAAQPGPGRAPHVRLPDRHAGHSRRALLGGHRIYLHTAEYDDGTPGEVTVTLPRESAGLRGMTDAFAQAVSLGLQHGVPLEAFVDAFALGRFGPAGTVEGDPDVARATSVPDYVVRVLAAQYLGRAVPEPEVEVADPPLPLLRLVG